MAGLPVHGLEQWLDEVQLFTDWYCPALGSRSTRRLSGGVGSGAWRRLPTDGLRARSPCCATIHAENIMLVAGTAGVAHFGLLDFQDALAGHPAYDLVSVLEDARRDVTPAVEAAMLEPLRRRDGAGRGIS